MEKIPPKKINFLTWQNKIADKKAHPQPHPLITPLFPYKDNLLFNSYFHFHLKEKKIVLKKNNNFPFI
jgi:hypothetical protein